jgi:hypothetical protein
MQEQLQSLRPWRANFQPVLRWGPGSRDEPAFIRFRATGDAHSRVSRGFELDFAGSVQTDRCGAIGFHHETALFTVCGCRSRSCSTNGRGAEDGLRRRARKHRPPSLHRGRALAQPQTCGIDRSSCPIDAAKRPMFGESMPRVEGHVLRLPHALGSVEVLWFHHRTFAL